MVVVEKVSYIDESGCVGSFLEISLVADGSFHSEKTNKIANVYVNKQN
jgi:hypothetical protein